MDKWIEKSVLKQVYKPRAEWVHKGMFGKLLVVGGSEQFTGSPIFNALSALRAGVDLVFIAAPERAALVASCAAPDLISYPLNGKKLVFGHVPTILEFAEQMNVSAAVIGCGLWRTEETKKAVRVLVRELDLPMVLDADALRAIAGNLHVLEGKKCILTPHVNEFKGLSGKEVKTNLEERAHAVQSFAKKIKQTVLLKGHVDVISDGSRVAFNKTGSVYMTKGGFGDTLSGICGALLARGIDCFTAACAAAFINGRAGELAAKKFGEGTLASDLVKEIPSVLK
jgi:NAD(P)H-hydrate epimerase